MSEAEDDRPRKEDQAPLPDPDPDIPSPQPDYGVATAAPAWERKKSEVLREPDLHGEG